MEAALKIDGGNGTSKQPQMNEVTAELIREVVFSNLNEEQKERAYSVIEKCSSIIVSDCHFETEEINRMSLWEMIHINWLGGKPVSRRG